jgi:CNT family concentrative nucleoside transporter
VKKLLLIISLICACSGIFAQGNTAQADNHKTTRENTVAAVQIDSSTQATADSLKIIQEANSAQMKAGKENPYKDILAQKDFTFNILSILRGMLGMAVIIFIAWLFSMDRKKICWKTVLFALLFQLIVAVSVIAFPAVQSAFEFVGKMFVAVLDWTRAGSNFLFGSLMDVNNFGFIFVLQILPTIIFFSALTSMLFYLGILQKIVWVMAWLLSKSLNLTGAESLSTAGNIFLGQTEAPLMVKAYIPRMTKSEVMLVMTAGMTTMAGGVLAAYIGLLGGGDRLMEIEFAKHLLSASVMAAPGAIAISKIIRPQTEDVDNTVEVPKERIGKNLLDSISNGATDGLKLAANVAAMLLVFYALIAGFNFICGKIGEWTTLNGWIADITDGRYTGLSLQFILSYLFAPIIWLTGVSGDDLALVGRLLGEKLIMTEFVGYQSLAEMIQSGAFLHTKSVILATYVLCGFANFASVGIQIGGIGGIAPNQRPVLSAFGMRALLGATLGGLMSASMVGMFV